MNESLSKQKHQGLYPSGTTVIIGDSISVIEERINKKDRPVIIIIIITIIIIIVIILFSVDFHITITM